MFLPSCCFSWIGLRPFLSHCDNPKFTPFDYVEHKASAKGLR